jgi:glucose-6-phosphate isomerase
VVDYSTAPIVWGQAGTNGQHAFYQLLHQGTHLVPCDFLAPAKAEHALDKHQAILLANFLAQPEALMRGRTEQEALELLESEGLSSDQARILAAHKTFPGNCPSNSILFERLSPEVMGSLIALYEHKVFVQGAIWGLNPFDQMGVELGKQLTKAILPEIESALPVKGHDSSTAGLIKRLRRMRQRS